VSEWIVALIFSEGSSNKFWRARVEDKTLYVNFGKIGSAGQTQVKAFPTADAAQKELAKLEREKRKKGYLDEGSAPVQARSEDRGDDDEEDEEEDDEAATTPPPEHADYALSADGRSVDLTLSLEGEAIRTVVVERYGSAGLAKEAFERLKQGMEAEGYRRMSGQK
jgi:predicted DNA-binding WGR domain protein